jgi:predicted RNA binding protein YcfA (HicA-like mRNA interferase family)
MPKLPPVSRRKFVQRLRELGFEGPYAGGKHPQMKRRHVTLIIPNEHTGDIGPGFLQRSFEVQRSVFDVRGFRTAKYPKYPKGRQ